MIALIAWRNVWRNPLRSGIVGLAIAIGLVSGVFMVSLQYGTLESRTRDIIQTQISHIQLHHPQYEKGGETKFILENGPQVFEALAKEPYVKSISGRILIPAMLESSKGNFGVELIGVNPEEEAELTLLKERMVAGDYFKEGRSVGIIIGRKLAEKIGAKTTDENGEDTYNFRRRLVFRFQTASNEISSLRVKVVGIYQTTNTLLEETQIFIRRQDVDQILEIPGEIHEIALITDERKELIEDKFTKISALPSISDNKGVKVERWSDIAPDIQFFAETIAASSRIIMIVILLALAFGIINTMLMAVLERTRELGMLMSVGMNKLKIFTMIMLETVFLTFIGAPVGLLTGWGLITYFNHKGIDMSVFTEGSEQFGFSSMVYPELPANSYQEIIIMVVATALLSAIYPAYKALQLNPSEAVRAI
ncbi:MAG: FtsX-like permease family protein [Bacteroidota bacterium]